MLDTQDSGKLRRLVDDARALCADGSLADLFGEYAGRRDLRAIARDLVFDHAAALVFPEHDDDVTELLTGLGLRVFAPVASVVVRRRLALRYGVTPDRLAVSIIRGVFPDGPDAGRGVEIFSVPRAGALAAHPTIVDDERAADTESHFAFTVRDPAAGTLEAVRTLFADRLAMRPDGGGYNPFDDAASGGRSVLYFAAPGGDGTPPARFELTCAGHYPDVIAAHQRNGLAEGDHAARLLSLLTGHWAARSVYVAVAAGIADALAEDPRTAREVADAAGCDPAATARLLRYLASLGIVAGADGGRYALTPVGRLLGADSAFADLVRIYGEEFYEAWGQLLPAVRDGHSAFGHRYGVEHFEYFAAHQETARTFDRGMSAVSDAVAGAVRDTYDFPAGATVVDIGGGNGTLLRTVLAANPDVRGVLFDRGHVAAAGAGAERLTSVAGDFFAEVPAGGDVYLLSRVLHDWDDENCLRILAVCRAACGPDATLGIVERLLPEDGGRPGAAGLALPWDMQMLAVTGGRERSRSEYDKLLAASGFTLQDTRPLPVDMNLLVARPS